MRALLLIAASLAYATAAPDGGTKEPIDLGEVTLVDGGPVSGRRFLIIIIPAPTDHDCRPELTSDCEI